MLTFGRLVDEIIDVVFKDNLFVSEVPKVCYYDNGLGPFVDS
jgi:hypothetical protein